MTSMLERRAMLATQEAAPLAAPACVALQSIPECVNLTLYRGDDFYLDISVTYADSGGGVDLSTAVVTAQIRITTEQDDPPLAVFESTVDANVIHLHLTADQATLLPHSSVWDCQIATPDVTTLVAGTITTVPDVTRLTG